MRELTIKDAAAELGKSRRTIEYWVASGRLRSTVRWGRRVVLLDDDAAGEVEQLRKEVSTLKKELEELRQQHAEGPVVAVLDEPADDPVPNLVTTESPPPAPRITKPRGRRGGRRRQPANLRPAPPPLAEAAGRLDQPYTFGFVGMV